MTDTDRDETELGGTPIMPTGSGIADLEVAREMDALAEGEPLTDQTDAIASDDVSPTIDSAPIRESESHPS